MSTLFSPTTIRSLKLGNRFVRSATWEGMADDNGGVTQQLTACMAALARGRVGLIISGHAYVSRIGKASPHQLAVHGNGCTKGLLDLTEAVHREGGSIALQLAHGGANANAKASGLEPMGPSVMTNDDGAPKNREMTSIDLADTVHAFAQAARRAKESGFDAVQLHAAHGYLLSEFLSPAYNRREDTYGGSLENRARLLLEVVEAVRGEVGPDYPVLVKMNSEDFIPGGLSTGEALRVAAMLEEKGVDGIEFSGGIPAGEHIPIRVGQFKGFETEAWYKETARRFKAERSIPLMLVGGIRSYETAEKLVDEGWCDYVSMSRPLIREPGLIKRWKEGDHRPATCISDNLCFRPAMIGRGTYCVTDERERKKQEGASANEPEHYS
ncbi:MAG: NADH:flavin oxidoreductase [Proteobacteria bacterium]|nr:NADH:flavin oxidoreductase [Pseudomonadota bacterium]MBU1612364.1 NADH:flavin oxidoreductase [Pseudomonadota bacterium]